MADLFCFFGNPGAKYAGTRHNFAWQFLDWLISPGAATWNEKFSALYTRGSGGGSGTIILKPQGYYNRVGQSAADCATWFKIPKDEICAIHDDVELPFGTVGVQFGGGTGGNNGLRSMKEHLGEGFFRIRLGIGRPQHGSLDNWVLSNFSQDEQILHSGIFLLAKQYFEKLQSEVSFGAALRRGLREKAGV